MKPALVINTKAIADDFINVELTDEQAAELQKRIEDAIMETLNDYEEELQNPYNKHMARQTVYKLPLISIERVEDIDQMISIIKMLEQAKGNGVVAVGFMEYKEDMLFTSYKVKQPK